MPFHLLMGLTAFIDQAFKSRIEAQPAELFPRPMKNSGGRIQLYRDHNQGFPFGFLGQYREMVRAVSLTITAMLGGVYLHLHRERKNPAARLALALTIGGSASNLFDRYVRGYVVDYFSIQLGPLKKVVFNLGDLFVIFGTGLLALGEISKEFRPSGKAQNF